MKNYIAIAALLAAGTAVANAAEQTVDLSPTAINTGVNASGISASNVAEYALNTWYGTWENGNLANQVSVVENALRLQIGAAATQNSGGNYAAVRFELGQLKDVSSIELNFDMKCSNHWGNAAFAATYSADMYGFTEDGESKLIGTWSSSFTKAEAATYSGEGLGKTLLVEDEYSSYGLIFRSMETTDVGGGYAMDISNIKVIAAGSPIPEPSAFGLLAGIGALALVASRRRRK